MKKLIFAALVLPGICGCSEFATRTVPNVDLSKFERVYVEHRLTDGRGVDQAIVSGLRHLGYDATFGPPIMMPHDAELVIRYQDEWNFDFTTYPLSINLDVFGAKSDKLLASAHYYRPSITGNKPSDLIDRILAKTFKAKTPLPDLPPPSNTPDLSN
jgi:hypothetical protein